MTETSKFRQRVTALRELVAALNKGRCYDQIDIETEAVATACLEMEKALEKYASGDAFQFTRENRGEIEFSSGASSKLAREVLAKLEKGCE